MPGNRVIPLLAEEVVRTVGFCHLASGFRFVPSSKKRNKINRPRGTSSTRHLSLKKNPTWVLKRINASFPSSTEYFAPRGRIHYKKFSDAPFTGRITGPKRGSFKSGKRHGPWVSYYGNGKLEDKGNYKDGKKVELLAELFSRSPLKLLLRGTPVILS